MTQRRGRAGFLLLEDGTLFRGSLLGGDAPSVAEVVFTTNMSGYQEVFTDPSFRGLFQLDEKDFQQSLRGERIGRAANSPLVMTGLVLAGANNAKTPGRGIVTGEALIDRDLSGLDLAVLSACETGLGDLGAGGEGVFPQKLAALLVKGMHAFVLGAGDEYKAAGGHNRADKRFGAGARDSPSGQLHVFPERNLPGEFARREVNRAQRPPRRLDRWVALVIQEPMVAHVPKRPVSRIVAHSGFGESDDIRDVVRVDIE